MKFRTEIGIQKSKYQFSYADKLFLIGSCFTQNIGDRLKALKFQVDINPFGVLYNPVSVRKSMELLLEKKEFTEEDLRVQNDLWFSFYHHSSFSHYDKNTCLKKINDRIEESHAFLKQTNFLFITFGTSLIYQLKESGEVVSNCHKVPAKEFRRSMIPSCEIYDEYVLLIKKLRVINPDLKIIFTLSPVRHLKDGFVENMHSKANLLIAIHQLVDFMDDVFYFPAFEIMLDDLRDYRFYAEDLVHPNDLAVNYIWEKFQKVFINESEFDLMKKVQKIMNAVNHKPFNAEGEEYKRFVKTSLDQIKEIQNQQNAIDFVTEIEYFKQFI